MLRKLILKHSNKIYFIFARFLGLGLKAGYLWYLSHNDLKSDSYTLSLYFICLASTMVLFNNEAYFDFYKNKFDFEVSYYTLLKSKYNYIKFFVNHFVFFFILVFVCLLFITNSWFLSVLFFLLVLLEKVLDELLRFKLFSKEYLSWSNIFITYTVVPIFFSFIISFFFKQFGGAVYLAMLFVVILLNLYLYLPKIFIRIFFFNTKNLNFDSLRLYFYSYKERFFFNQFLSYLSSNILVIDKFLLLSNNKENLASYYLISQFCNGINLLIDYFFLSTRRASYINNKMTIYNLFGNGRLLLIGFFGFISCNIFMYFYLTYLDNSFITLSHAFLLSSSYLIFGLVASFSQYAFWNVNKKIMVFIEISFFAICTILYYSFLNIIHFNFLYSILTSFLIAHFFRFFFYVMLVNKLNKTKR